MASSSPPRSEINWVTEVGSFFHPHFPKHPCFHVEQQMAVIRPPPQGVGGHAIRASCAWRHVDRVLAHMEVALVVLDVAPHAVQVDRMRHHRVVDEHDAQTFAVFQSQRAQRRRT